MENKLKTASIQSDIPHCKHFVVRKKRYCKMTVKKGAEYCGEHMPSSDTNANDETDSKLRIVCPLDRKQLSLCFCISKHRIKLRL